MELSKTSLLVDVFLKERNKWSRKLKDLERRIVEKEREELEKEGEVVEMRVMLDEKEGRIKSLRNKMEILYKEKFNYKGNGDKSDKLDMLLIQYLKEKKLYI
jgi:hypothetical protein